MRRLHFREKKKTLCNTATPRAIQKKKERGPRSTPPIPSIHPLFPPQSTDLLPKTQKIYPKKGAPYIDRSHPIASASNKTKMIKREEPIIQSSHDYQPKTKNQEREGKKTQPLATTILKTKTLNNARVVPQRAIATEKKRMPFSLCLPYK